VSGLSLKEGEVGIGEGQRMENRAEGEQDASNNNNKQDASKMQ